MAEQNRTSGREREDRCGVPTPRRLAGAGRALGLALSPPAGLEAVALAVHLEDVDVVGEPVEERAGEPLGAEHARPLVERQVAGDQDRAPLVASAHPAAKLSGRIPATSSVCGSRRRTTRCSASWSRWCGASGTRANPTS